jgi:hypothetical protein
MRKEFESGLAQNIAGKKRERKTLGKAWMALVLGAALLAVSAVAAAEMQDRTGEDNNANPDPELPDRDRLQDGSCEDTTLPVTDGVDDCICDCDCDCECDCVNPDCPCCDDGL